MVSSSPPIKSSPQIKSVKNHFFTFLASQVKITQNENNWDIMLWKKCVTVNDIEIITNTNNMLLVY